MAIVMMVNESELGQPGTYRLDNFHGAEKGRVSHNGDCPHRNTHDLSGARSPECGTRCFIHTGLVMKRSYEGCVLYVGEHNYHDDSDFYAMVWDEESQTIRKIGYGTTRAWTYPNNAVVDATPEVQAKAAAWQAERDAEKAARLAAIEAATPRKGKTVEVVSGRKVPLGTVGQVFWIGQDRFSGKDRLGIKAGVETYFTAASNVKVVAAAA